jgi:type IV pilus assembly protein PilP
MMRLSKIAAVLPTMLVVLLISGCGTGNKGLADELETMSKDIKRRIDPLPVVNQYQAFPYADEALRDPFGVAQVSQVAVVSRGGIQPDLKREKEPLESFALETITMVGTLVQNGVPTALVTTESGLFKVTVGRHIGMDFGRIVAITPSTIEIKEIVQDSSNYWSERDTTLNIQEKEGKK